MSELSANRHGDRCRSAARRSRFRRILVLVLLIPSLVALSINGTATASTVSGPHVGGSSTKSGTVQPYGVGDSSGCTVDGVRVAQPDDQSHCDVTVLHADAAYDISNPSGQYFGDLYAEQDNGDGTYTDLSSEQLYVFNDGGMLTIGALPNTAASSSPEYLHNGSAANSTGGVRPSGDVGASCLTLAISAIVLGVATFGFFAAGTYAAFAGGLDVLGHLFTLTQLNQMATLAGTGAALFGYVRSVIGC